MSADGWPFAKAMDREYDGVQDDPFYGASYLKEFYFKANPKYEGR